MMCAVWLWLIVGGFFLYRNSNHIEKTMPLFLSLGAVIGWPFWIYRQQQRQKRRRSTMTSNSVHGANNNTTKLMSSPQSRVKRR